MVEFVCSWCLSHALPLVIHPPNKYVFHYCPLKKLSNLSPNSLIKVNKIKGSLIWFYKTVFKFLKFENYKIYYAV